MPRFSAEQLRSATTDAPPDPVFLEALPDDLPPVVAATASEVTAGQPTHFDQMVVLQDWFRSEFTYSTDVPRRSRQLGDRVVPRGPSRLLRAVRRDVCGDGPLARDPGPGRGRLYPGRAAGRRQLSGARPQRPRLAGGVVRRLRLGAVRADPRARHAGRRGAHRCSAAAGRRSAADHDDDNDDDHHDDDGAGAPTTTVAGQGAAAAAADGDDDDHGRRLPTQSPPPPVDDVRSMRSRGWLVARGAVAVVAALVRLARDRPPLAASTPGADHRSRRTPCSSSGTGRCGRWRRSASAAIRRSPRSRSPNARPTRSRPSPSPSGRSPVVATTASYAPADEVVELADADRHGHGHEGPHGWCALVEDTVEDSLSLPERLKRYFTVWH